MSTYFGFVIVHSLEWPLYVSLYVSTFLGLASLRNANPNTFYTMLNLSAILLKSLPIINVYGIQKCVTDRIYDGVEAETRKSQARFQII